MIIPALLLAAAAGAATPLRAQTESQARMHDDFTVVYTQPDLNQPQSIWNNKALTIGTNHNDAVGYTTLTVTDTDANEVILISSNYATGREPGSDAPITWNVVGKYKFMQGHRYAADLIFYNGRDSHTPEGIPVPEVGRASFSFEGSVAGYQYSAASLLETTPAPESYIGDESDAVFTYRFSAPVELYKAETPLGEGGANTYAPECISCNADRTEWTLDLSESKFIRSLSNGITINIYVRDTDGAQLKGNRGEDTGCYFQHSWDCEFGAFRLVALSPAEGCTLDRLTEVEVRSTGGDRMNWSWTGTAEVCDADGTRIGRLVFDSDRQNLTEVKFSKWVTPEGETLPISLTAPGEYTLRLSHGCFITGERYDTNLSHSFTGKFSISGLEDPSHPAIQETLQYSEATPQPESTVKNLESISVFYPETVRLSGNEAIVVRENGEGAAADTICRAELSRAKYLWSRIDIRLTEPVETDGHYIIVIPRRTIGNEEFFDSDGNSGLCNPELTLRYTVVSDKGAAYRMEHEAHGADRIYDLTGRSIRSGRSDGENRSGLKGVYIVNGQRHIAR